MGSLDPIHLKAVAFRLVTCKREVLWSKEDTSGVSAKGTLMLKSVMALMSVPYGSGYSGNPDGLCFEWSQRIYMLRANEHRTSIRQTAKADAKTGIRIGIVTGSGYQVSGGAGWWV
ncbi:hypothetical protein TIFTF001_042644 [Ficus carica]|uniref:Uncharacterized protein n=1 Tax=Ficus carica TaxID=3494 RepID=A0AA87ZP09_FICCA|nr:hypothetical protein TIFTF001_042644 [Ficus carica]